MIVAVVGRAVDRQRCPPERVDIEGQSAHSEQVRGEEHALVRRIEGCMDSRDPPEAAIQSLFLMAIVFILPLHFITVIAVLITMTVWAVVNHLGLDLFPPAFLHHWLGRWFIGPAHHSIHHHRYRRHYGLYFTFWDKLLGTNDLSYERDFDIADDLPSSVPNDEGD